MDEVTVPACKVEGGMQCAPSPVLQALLCLGVWVASLQQAGSLTNVYQHIFDFHIWSKKHCNARQSRAQQLTAQYGPLKEWTHAKVHLGSARVLIKTDSSVLDWKLSKEHWKLVCTLCLENTAKNKLASLCTWTSKHYNSASFFTFFLLEGMRKGRITLELIFAICSQKARPWMSGPHTLFNSACSQFKSDFVTLGNHSEHTSRKKQGAENAGLQKKTKCLINSAGREEWLENMDGWCFGSGLFFRRIAWGVNGKCWKSEGPGQSLASNGLMPVKGDFWQADGWTKAREEKNWRVANCEARGNVDGRGVTRHYMYSAHSI